MQKKKVKCLYRVSTLKQVEKDDIPMQRESCRAFVSQHPDWEIIDEVYEKGVSGYKVRAKDRGVISKLLLDAQNHSFDILVVYMMDRLGRIAEETSALAIQFDLYGIEVWSVMEGQQHYDTQNDKLMNYLRFWMAEGESAKTSIRTKTRLGQIVKEGRFRGGGVPYGYRLERQGRTNHKGQEVNEIVVDEKEALVVKKIFQLSSMYGYGSRKIASILKQEGFRNRKGKPFHPSTLQNMLKNVQYVGILRSGETKSEIFPHLQIISPYEFQQVQEQIATHRSNYEKSRLSPLCPGGSTLLSGNIYCGSCGGRIISSSTRKSHHRTQQPTVRIPVYRCYNRIQHKGECDGQSSYRAAIVDSLVSDSVCHVLDCIQLTDTETYIDKRKKQELDLYQTQLKKLEESYDKTIAEKKKLAEHIVSALEGNGPFSADDLKERMDYLKEEAEILSHQMEEQRKILENIQQKEENISQQIKLLKGYAPLFREGTIEEKRRIISALIEKVSISRGYDIHIQYRIGVDLLENLDT